SHNSAANAAATIAMNATSAGRSRAECGRSHTAAAAAAAIDTTRITGGTIVKPMRSTRYAETIADASSVAADAAAASAPGRGGKESSVDRTGRAYHREHMFIGHFGLGLAAKRAAPAVSLGALFAAAQFADLLWPTLVLLGIEEVRIQPGITVVTPLDF